METLFKNKPNINNINGKITQNVSEGDGFRAFEIALGKYHFMFLERNCVTI